MHIAEKYSIEAGSPELYGPTITPEGVNFAITSKYADEVTLCLFDYDTEALHAEIPFDPSQNKTGHVWHAHVIGLQLPICYGYRFKKSKGKLFKRYFQDRPLIVDPYAPAIKTPVKWGEHDDNYRPLGVIAKKCNFDWEGDRPLNIPRNETVIYEMHVRGFTRDPSSKSERAGTFLGVIDKIPHLVDLGITAVELLPIFEFNECEYHRFNPITGNRLYNYWGYSTVHFFSPMNRYATKIGADAAALEFKQMVKELHKNGIEVILDVVFNHTAEGSDEGPIYSFKGIDCGSYYILDHKHRHQNYSGCGNTFNCNHPIASTFIKSCLRYWVKEMHVDGFRFDLASIFMRGNHGEPIAHSPLVDALSQDPILADTKFIAEPWDAAGLYNLGEFRRYNSKWSEWNDKYRDSARRFIKGDRGEKRSFAVRICGSDDLFPHGETPATSLNFVTAHDGFTLRDLVSYNYKDNSANAENDRDGNPNNISWNCGKQGETDDKAVLSMRLRQMKNFHLALMVSQGIPMLLMGDEYGHTRHGNNNTWCQDNSLNWFLWDELEKNGDFFRFFVKMIRFRLAHPILHLDRHLEEEDIDWHGTTPLNPDWDGDTQFLACSLKDPENSYHLYLAFNMHYQEIECLLPPSDGAPWRVIANTANDAPFDFYDEENAPVTGETILLKPHASTILKRVC